MPDPAGSRVSKTPSRFHSATEADVVLPTKGVASWRREFFEALDLVQSEIKRRFDQSGMETASLREETLLDAAKGSVGTEEDLRSLQLPGNIDVSGLQTRMLGDLTKDEDFCTVHELAVSMSSLHMQTRGLIKYVENLLQLCLSMPISVASSERSFSALRRLKTWLHNSYPEETHSPGLAAYTAGDSGLTGHSCSHEGVYFHHLRSL
ncbi:hypothetical protein KUCAC02_012910 [Chaenocephalus aceratus]|uniref:Uncharacterized protein n=1 Tax=Chaenocephalus aceratus TaxID=36190 RepID=A0ACB9XCZ9_CHAAC|nr:hypothetical protein KUCAC02_012910 [Chaenocephalus aceratus]